MNDKHSISFDIPFNTVKEKPKFKFSLRYLPESKRVDYIKEVYDEYTFLCQLSETVENNLELQTTLLSIAEIKFGTEDVGFIKRVPLDPEIIYQIENIESWEGVSVLSVQ